jgi:hypothetical protein
MLGFLNGNDSDAHPLQGKGDLNLMLGEAWVGIEMRTSSASALHYLARGESPELCSTSTAATVLLRARAAAARVHRCH